MRKLPLFLFAGVSMLAGASPVVAHHAFSAEFDQKRPVNLEGAVVKFELVNPHAWVHIEVKTKDGKTEVWAIEGGTPNTLQRRGITRDSLKPGTLVKVAGFQAKDGTLKANGRNLTFADGRVLFMGSSGTGAPTDGADATEKPK